jgi:protoheme ferro-lyase
MTGSLSIGYSNTIRCSSRYVNHLLEAGMVNSLNWLEVSSMLAQLILYKHIPDWSKSTTRQWLRERLQSSTVEQQELLEALSGDHQWWSVARWR